MGSHSSYYTYSKGSLRGIHTYCQINDNQHYPSQVALGWYMAWEATQSIKERDQVDHRLSVVPLIAPDYYGLQLMMVW